MSRAESEREKETLKDLLPIVWLTHPSFLLPCRDAQFFLSVFLLYKTQNIVRSFVFSSLFDVVVLDPPR